MSIFRKTRVTSVIFNAFLGGFGFCAMAAFCIADLSGFPEVDFLGLVTLNAMRFATLCLFATIAAGAFTVASAWGLSK